MDEAPDPPPPGPGPAAPRPPGTDAEAAEIRRLVDEGAGSPEALRELAARLRAQRDREDQRWRAEVKPALLKAKKRGGSLPASVTAAAPSPFPVPAPPPGAALPPPPPAPGPPPDLPAPPPPGPASGPVSPEAVTTDREARTWMLGGLLAVLLMVLVALNTSVWLLVVPVVAVLAWAWREGHRSGAA